MNHACLLCARAKAAVKADSGVFDQEATDSCNHRTLRGEYFETKEAKFAQYVVGKSPVFAISGVHSLTPAGTIEDTAV